jgi:cytochrome P450
MQSVHQQATAHSRARDVVRPPGPRGAHAARVLARIAAGQPLQACTSLFARYGDTIYLPARPWEGLYIFSRPDQAEHILAANQDNYVKAFTYRPLRILLGDGLLTADGPAWRRHRRVIQPVFSTPNVASYAGQMDAAAQRAVRRWHDTQVIDLAGEMSALALDVAGQVLFGTDQAAGAPSLRRTLAAGQWLVLLGALLPVPEGPRSAGTGRGGCAGRPRAGRPGRAGSRTWRPGHSPSRRTTRPGRPRRSPGRRLPRRRPACGPARSTARGSPTR